MCEAQYVEHEQHMILKWDALQLVRDMYPELHFSMPSITVFLSTHASDAQLYHHLTKIIRLCVDASSMNLLLLA